MTASGLTPAAIATTTMLEVSGQSGGGTVDGWYIYHQASGTPRWGRSDGSSSTGSFFAMYDAQSTPNRALGAQGSASIACFFGVVLKNTSGSTIDSITVTFDAVMNRNPSTTANAYPASYRVSSTAPVTTSSTSDGTLNDAAGTWTSDAALSFTTPSTGTGAPGTQAAISPLFKIGGASKTDTITGLNWGNDQYLYIRWKETDESGADSTAGVDNFSVSIPGTAVAIDNTGTPAAGNILAGSADVPLFGFRLSPSGGSVDFTGLKLTTTGTATASDLSNFRVVYDADNSGTFNAGDSVVSGTGAALGNPINFSISGQTGFSTARRYLVVADVAAGAVGGNTFTASIAASGDTTNSGTASGTAAGNQQAIAFAASDLTMAGGGESAAISSLINDTVISTTGQGVQVWQVTFTNPGGNAGTATISAITVTQGANNQVVNWQNTIQAAELFDGSIALAAGVLSPTNITFTGLSEGVPDSGSATLTLRISLKSTGGALTDNSKFQFALAGGNVATSGNGVTTAAISSDQTKNQIAVVATKLALTGMPAQVIVGQAFTVGVQARDANDNLDVDNSASVAFTRIAGGGALSGGAPQSLSSGTQTWSLQYNTAETFTIQAAGGGLAPVISGNITALARSLAISGYMANPAGTDSPYEYVQLKALQAVDFSATPVSIVWANNGIATANGWVEGGAITYKFNVTSGTLGAGDVAYVGGTGKLINGTNTADISAQTWLRAIDTGASTGDGFGNANSAGVMGNGGANADGIAIFIGTSLTDASVPIDAVFYGAAVGSAVVGAGADGYTLPSNDLYNGGFLKSTNTIFFDPASGAYAKLTGTYNTNTSQWTVPRTASSVVSPASTNDIASGITLVGNAISNAGSAQISIPSNGAVSIKFYGVPNNQYVVRTTTNLAVPWWSIDTNTAGNDGSWIFTDLNATNAQQYYRIALP
jgi:hypothetical protein